MSFPPTMKQSEKSFPWNHTIYSMYDSLMVIEVFFSLNFVQSLIKVILETIWRRQWHPTPVLLPGKAHGWRSLVGCSAWGLEESNTTEWLHFHFSLSCIGEGNGNPLQCSCLENPRDGGAWWAVIYGVTQSRTRLKCLQQQQQRITRRASLVAQLIKNPTAMGETGVWSLGWEDPLEKRKATHFSILVWRIPQTV